MSRTSERLRATLLRRLRHDGNGDDGFTLIEVIAALTVFALASSAAIGMIITGMRASVVAKMDTGAKNLTQQQVELMRNLPFHLSYNTGKTVAENTNDLLNHYYPNRTVAAAGASGFVAACGTETTVCAGRPATEPQAGSYYRTVIPQVPGQPRYQQVIVVQFVDSQRRPLAPSASYDAFQPDPADLPASRFAFASVTTTWSVGDLSKSFTLDTYIAEGRPAQTLIAAQATSTLISISTRLDSATQLLLNAGVLSLDGSLATGARASGRALGAEASITGSTLQTITGALASQVAPPNQTSALGASASEQTLDWNGHVGVVYFGSTSSSFGGTTVTSGLPAISGASAKVLTPSSGNTRGIRVKPPVSGLETRRVAAGRAIAFTEQDPSVPNGHEQTRTNGSLSATGGAGRKVSTTVAGGGGGTMVRLFQTDYAPGGVVLFKLNSMSLTCQTDGTAASAPLTYHVEVFIHNADAPGTYRSAITARETDASDPLAGVSLDTVVWRDPVDSTKVLRLRDYISGWGTLAAPGVTAGRVIDADANRVLARYDSIASVTTVPLRADDPTSTLSLQLGKASCVAEDNR